MDSQTFLGQVRAAGLLSEEQLASASQRFAPESPVHELSGALVEQGWLTRFQVEQIWAGNAKDLTLGQYRLLEELGKGGFGCVYKAMHTLMNRIVALKVISPELVDDARARAWFRREVLATTQFQHPNIVMAYDANEVDEILFLVMEYVDGPNLADVVRRQGPLPVGLACNLMLQAARALQYAHEKGMVHRDIKPGNLLLPRVAASDDPARQAAAGATSQALVKIVDFGLARLQSQGSANTLMGIKDKGFLGTPDYVSPEQARNIHEVDIRSDLYSLGCTFYFTLTGRPPFLGKHPLEIVLQHVEEEPVGLEVLRPEIPPALASIVRRLMAKRPAQRFQTPADLISELNFFFGSGALGPASPARPSGVVSIRAQTPCPRDADEAAEILTPSQAPMPAMRREPAPANIPGDAMVARTAILSSIELGRAGAKPPSAEELTIVGSGASPAPAAQPTASGHVEPQQKREWGAEKETFCRLWRQWTAVVEEVLQGEGPALTEADYGALHADLVCLARAQGHFANAPAALANVEALVAPWLSLHALAATDHQTLASLIGRCWQLEKELGLRRPSRWPGQWLAVAAAFLLAVVLGGWLMSGAGTASFSRLSVHSLWRLVTANPTVAVALAVPVLVVGSVQLFTRLSRS